MRRWNPAVTTSVTIAAALLAISGCSGDGRLNEHRHTAKQSADHASHHEGHHVHTAPRGGTLVELGDHFANLELLLDASEGSLTAYVLDAHAENAVRLTAAMLEARLDSLERDGQEISLFQPIRLELLATENALTGETVGDSSQFSARHDDLVNVTGLTGALLEITVRGQTFRDVPLDIGRPKAGDHP